MSEVTEVQMVDQKGDNINPFLYSVSCGSESGFENLHVFSTIDEIVQDLFDLTEMGWNDPCLEEYHALLAQDISEADAKSSLKAWYEYHGIKMPGNLANFSNVARAFEDFLVSSRGEKFFSGSPESKDKKSAMQRLIFNLRELGDIAYNDMSSHSEIVLDDAIEILGKAKFASDYDSLCLAYQAFQANAMSQNVDWHIMTACFRYNVKINNK